MFGLTFEKLLVIAVIAAVIVGPQRLPQYAQRLGELVRGFRAFMDTARERTVAETGLTAEEWKALDPRRYDPRRIVREALDPAPVAPSGSEAAPRIVVSPAGPDASCERPDPEGVVLGSEMQPVPAQAGSSGAGLAAPSGGPVAPIGGEGSGSDGAGSAPGQAVEPVPERRMKWVVVGGSSGHPRRMLVPVDDGEDDEASREGDAREAPGVRPGPVAVADARSEDSGASSAETVGRVDAVGGADAVDGAETVGRLSAVGGADAVGRSSAAA